MPNFVSPGVYTIEKDISDYAPSINTSVVGIVGFASKGPTNTPTLITSQTNLLRTFGNPSEYILGQALEGALEILEQTNSLYFVRAVNDSTAFEASAYVSIGSCPAFQVSAPVAAAAPTGFGVGRPLTLRIQVYDNDGIAKYPQNGGEGRDFVIPVGTSTTQVSALQRIVGTGLDTDHLSFYSNGNDCYIVGAYAGSGASITASAFISTAFRSGQAGVVLKPIASVSSAEVGFGASGVFVSSIKAHGSTFYATGANSVAYLVESLYPGAGYNTGVTVNGDPSGNSITVSPIGGQNFTVVVNDQGVAAENYKVNFIDANNFIEDVINVGVENATSDYAKGYLIRSGANATPNKLTDFGGSTRTLFGTNQFRMTSQFTDSRGITTKQDMTSSGGARFLKLVQGTYSMAGGTNGDDIAGADVALIGNASVTPKTGMQSLDDPVLNIGIALIPGIQSQNVQNALVTLAETTQNFLALVAPPVAVGTVQDAIDWTNGKSTSTAGSRTAALNSSYAAVYWPWVKVFSVFDGKDRWYDPTIFAARQMAYTDSVADSWFAPAGFRRGRLTKPTEVEVKLNQGDRDTMYSGGNVVNPIVSFPQQGITIFGQRTTQRSPTALDRINVRRLMIYIRKIILLATQRFVFEPNDEFTWAQVEGVLNPFLDDIRRRRGITEFRVVCDETTNTPLRIDRNEMWTKVLIKPTKTAEILIFEVNLTNQSAQLGSL